MGWSRKKQKGGARGLVEPATGSTIQSCLVLKTLAPRSKREQELMVRTAAGKTGPLVPGCPLSQASSEQ